MQSSTNYPALPALASGEDDHPAPPIVQGQVLTLADATIVTNQHKRRKTYHEVLGGATGDEVTASRIREIQVLTEVGSGQAAVPAWAQTMNNNVQALMNAINHSTAGLAALSNTVNDPNTGLAALSNTVNDLNTGLRALSTRMDIESARNLNRTTVRSRVCEITPLPDSNGVLPGASGVWFPANTNALHEANTANMNQLMAFYGLAAGETLDAKHSRIKNHLGILVA